MEPWAADPKYSADKRVNGQDWPRAAHTMVGVKRLNNLISLVSSVIQDGIPGDLIETGVWRGGCCILMQGILETFGETHRKIFVADSFQGLPPPDPARYAADAGDIHHTFPELAVSSEQVRSNFHRYGLLKENVVFIEGFFEDTLPKLDTGPLAIIRLDGDMYGSTMVALEALYPKLSDGGYVIVDDYGAVPACKLAVTDFRRNHGVNTPIELVDWTGVWWRKPSSIHSE
ncbi:macrocin O-methyltransferase (plasmid) [Methylocystis iwaonis]|uniref:Macrocin O-methyltransferase n=2 Tax=Methylocystis iwaonis TaxID=2885079 RepID=A0ABN6VMV5_9HYPH|nr:macrocin O-methyltransferase [Methylocystis iwaonis]